MQQDSFKIDIHIHSTFSDGKLSVREILDEAFKKNLKAISITDHDNIRSIKAVEDIIDDYELEYLRGVEISANIGKDEIHILAYNFNLDSNKFHKTLNSIENSRLIRANKIIKNLKKAGIDINFEEVLATTSGKNIGRPHIADILVKKKYCTSFQEAFDFYLNNDSPFYVPKLNIDPREVINAIHDAKGLAFWAHPGRYLTKKVVFKEMISAGIDGLEILHPSHNASQQKALFDIAAYYKLLISGGSDCHGIKINGEYGIGKLNIPYEYYKKIKGIK